jgi:hypothetical protein
MQSIRVNATPKVNTYDAEGNLIGRRVFTIQVPYGVWSLSGLNRALSRTRPNWVVLGVAK